MFKMIEEYNIQIEKDTYDLLKRIRRIIKDKNIVPGVSDDTIIYIALELHLQELKKLVDERGNA